MWIFFQVLFPLEVFQSAQLSFLWAYEFAYVNPKPLSDPLLLPFVLFYSGTLRLVCKELIRAGSHILSISDTLSWLSLSSLQ